MQISPLGKIVLGVYAIIVGLIMIAFHKQLKRMREDWYEHLPAVIWRGPTGTLLTVMLIIIPLNFRRRRRRRFPNACYKFQRIRRTCGR